MERVEGYTVVYRQAEDIPPDVLLLKSLHRAYDDSPSADEREQMQSMRQKQWEQMKGEW